MTEQADAMSAVESLWIFAIDTGRIDTAVQSEYHLSLLRRGASPRIVVKALLLRLAIRKKSRDAEQRQPA